VPAVIAWACAPFRRVRVCDASPLDARLRQGGWWQGRTSHPLAGRMTPLLDLASRLPGRVWFDPDPHAPEPRHGPDLLAAVPGGALLLFDLGDTHFGLCAQRRAGDLGKAGQASPVERVLVHSATVCERLVALGQGEDRQTVRLMEIYLQGVWDRSLTHELNPVRLPATYAGVWYRPRGRIEDAFLIVKRLGGLAYFWSGAQNSVELQRWATWLLYAVWVDLTDRVAEAWQPPFDAICLERVFRSLSYTDVVTYLATHAKWLGLVKRRRAPISPPQNPLDSESKTLT
jgi:hypothetical protein